MSCPCIESLKFKNPITKTINFGFVFYDDYGWYFSWGVEESEILGDHLEILKKALEFCCNDSDKEDFFDNIIENESIVWINGKYFDYDEVKEIFEKYL